MGGFARGALALSLLVGCASERDVSIEVDLPTVVVDGRTFTLGSAIAIDATSGAVLNVAGDACAAFYDDAAIDRIAGEEPMLLGAFALGPSGVLVIDDEDPRTYVTVGAPGDYVSLADGVLDVRLSFAQVVRQVRVGVDWYLDIQPVAEPITVEQSFAVLECDQ